MTLVCRAFWWELCEMARRLTLVGVFVVIEQGSMMQLMIGTAFSACYMLLQMQTGPCIVATTQTRLTDRITQSIARSVTDQLTRGRC